VIWFEGSPKDRDCIAGWDICPPAYVYPVDASMVASMDTALKELVLTLKKPLARPGSGGQTFTVWQDKLKPTKSDPMILTRVGKQKVI